MILDFFAHWCGPCIRSFPDLKNLYEANKDKGLVVVGVTSYYGFYKQENAQKRDMEKDTEFAKMGEFIKDHSMTWPVIYTDKANYDLYGVSGIPHVVLIDKKGAVHKIKVGYSPDSFAEFRKVVEALPQGRRGAPQRIAARDSGKAFNGPRGVAPRTVVSGFQAT